jgi:hypothetical protein
MLQKAPENYRAAFARRRSGVRIPSAPLSFYGDLQVKIAAQSEVRIAFRSCVHQRGAVEGPHVHSGNLLVVGVQHTVG